MIDFLKSIVINSSYTFPTDAFLGSEKFNHATFWFFVIIFIIQVVGIFVDIDFDKRFASDDEIIPRCFIIIIYTLISYLCLNLFSYVSLISFVLVNGIYLILMYRRIGNIEEYTQDILDGIDRKKQYKKLYKKYLNY